ncbi:hypothetical protein [Acinetobacter seifertii]|uniref:hypothetical protein n=1 Tax=Acinetobacter seifertii TaxID=1530123 RepID=UPI00190324ED|nr:hypothetical protein [Acinetobacter seifertii]MBJ9425157.1 hypothetical protein [Acinetobacter seifertii]
MSHFQDKIAGRLYKFSHIICSDILDMAKIKANHYEAMLTKALCSILGPEISPGDLTVNERYAIYLKYLSFIEDKNLDRSIDISDYLHADLNNFSTKRIEENGVSARHLTGLEAEALEIGCENTADWILGAMALQVGCNDIEGLPALPPQKTLDFTCKIIQSRSERLLSLDQSEFNDLFNKFSYVGSQLNTLVDISYSAGIVLNKVNNGGTDDAPVRFRATSAITGPARELYSILVQENAAVQS